MVTLLLLTGCGASAQKLSEQNDQLRRENMQLVRQVTQLRENIHGRLDEIKALRQKKGLPNTANHATPPKVMFLALDRYTNAVDTNHDGIDDHVRIYLETLDDARRFIPVAATVAVQVAYLKPSQPPVILVEKNYDHAAVAASYRSNLTGTHYTFDLPLPEKLDPKITQITLALTLFETATGKTLTTQRSLPLDLN